MSVSKLHLCDALCYHYAARCFNSLKRKRKKKPFYFMMQLEKLLHRQESAFGSWLDCRGHLLVLSAKHSRETWKFTTLKKQLIVNICVKIRCRRCSVLRSFPRFQFIRSFVNNLAFANSSGVTPLRKYHGVEYEFFRLRKNVLSKNKGTRDTLRRYAHWVAKTIIPYAYQSGMIHCSLPGRTGTTRFP